MSLTIDYQSPGHRDCSEQFYKDCVQEELEGREASREDRDKMMGILNRMKDQQEEEEEDSDDDEDPVELSERLRGVSLENTEEVWSLLTEDEREQFSLLARSGDVTSVLPQYRPWWDYQADVKKIRELNETEDDTFKERCPPLAGDIPSFSRICSKPSDFIKFGIFNILYAYAYGVKFFLGDYEEETEDFVNLVQLLSQNLRGHNYTEVDTALESAASQVNHHPDLSISLQFSREVKRDVIKIIRGPGLAGSESYYVLAALSDLKLLFNKTVKRLKKVSRPEKVNQNAGLPGWLQEGSSKPDLQPAEVKKNLKKIEFYLSWCQDHYPQLRSLTTY